MANNKWTQPASPPPPLFVGKAERNFVKQISDEIIEKIVGEQILYFPIDIERSNFHPLYGEAIKKTFLPPLRVYSMIEYVGSDRVQEQYGFDNLYNINVHMHKRRLTEDQNLFARLGDFVQYDGMYFEIVDIFEPRYLFGQDSAFTSTETSVEITAVARQARQGLFNAD
jgi:hypothetical protein